MKYVLLAAIAIIASGCTQPQKAKRVLEDAGYKNVDAGGYAVFACSEKDFFATSFKAVSANTGRVVKGAVCSGFLFKNTTIRLD